MVSRADSHDLDKLKRWQKDLAEDTPHAPAVYAIFLVSEKDKVAHDLFRTYRSAFEERGVGFAHLVIFGQHGVSAAVRQLQSDLDLAHGVLPTLLLFSGDVEDAEYITIDVVTLPQGESKNLPPDRASWLTLMFWSDAVMEGGHNVPALATQLMADSPQDAPSDSSELGEQVLEDLMLWAESRLEDSGDAAGPPQLNVVLKQVLSDLCAEVVQQLEQ